MARENHAAAVTRLASNLAASRGPFTPASGRLASNPAASRGAFIPAEDRL
jgi:hypothetical protein